MGLGVMVCAVTLTACGGSGGSAVTQPGGTQSTQAAPPTTSGVRYVSGASGNQPALDVSLFFAVPAGSIQIARVHSSATVYSVSGGFTAGTVRGTVAGTFTPDTTTATFSGTFTGTLSALLAGGCQAVRTYSGSLTASSLNWAAGGQVNDCGGTSPLSFSMNNVPASGTPATTTTTTTIPVTGNVTGTWTVTLIHASGNYPNQISLVQTNSSLSGSEVVGEIPPIPGFTITELSSVIAGSVTGTAISFTDTDKLSLTGGGVTVSCQLSIAFSGQLNSAATPTAMNGTYTSTDESCTGAGIGTVTVPMPWSPGGQFTGTKQASSPVAGSAVARAMGEAFMHWKARARQE